jgi:hypothetical protein
VEHDERILSAREWISTLIDDWPGVPALIRDRHLTVVAANPLARALTSSFTPGANLARSTFLDAAGRSNEPCWAAVTTQVAAMLRDSLDHHHGDGEFRGLVGELSAKSSDFSDAWAAETRPTGTGVATFVGSTVGDLTLSYRELWIDESHEHALMLWRSASATAAQQLRALADTL